MCIHGTRIIRGRVDRVNQGPGEGRGEAGPQARARGTPRAAQARARGSGPGRGALARARAAALGTWILGQGSGATEPGRILPRRPYSRIHPPISAGSRRTGEPARATRAWPVSPARPDGRGISRKDLWVNVLPGSLRRRSARQHDRARKVTEPLAWIGDPIASDPDGRLGGRAARVRGGARARTSG